ncbi:sensor histidine kinase [Streptomyces sp. BR1]|uniref:sensor histidine kinase n=1 Tax=Streptomyces sp. BR1 TaxID=1592323 RepID=UPI00402B7D85
MMAPRYAVYLMAAVYAGFAAIGTANLLKMSDSSLDSYSSVVLVVCCYAIQMLHCSPYTQRLRARYGRWTLWLQAFIAFAPVQTGHQSGIMCGFLAGAATVILGPRLGWFLFGLITSAVVLIALAEDGDFLTTLFMALATCAVGLITFALSRLGDLVFDLHRRRAETAWVAVSKERVRFTQDLHDVLSYSLSAITLKSELSYRLIGTNDERARRELSESLEITRRTLAEIRSVVHGNRRMLLSKEIELASRVLDSAGLAVTVQGEFDKVEPRVSGVLAVVLREAVTNLLRHSQATRCRIQLRRHSTLRGRTIRLSVSNDGASGSLAPLAAERRGSGLDNMAARLEAVDGSLRTSADGGWFRLEAECPLLQQEPTPAPTAFEPCSSPGPESRQPSERN